MDKILNLLGLARRAGRLACGSDAVKDGIAKGSTAMVLLTSDASEAHQKYLAAAGFNGNIIHSGYTMEDMFFATGKKICIVGINDAGFADAILKQYEQEGKRI